MDKPGLSKKKELQRTEKMINPVLWAPASSVGGVMDETRQKSHGLPKSCGGQGMARPLSQGESASTLAWTGFSWLSNSIHQKRFSFIMLRFALGNYFLQIAKERMLLITSYRLTRKKCCKFKGPMRVISLVTFQSLGELAQTSGNYFKDNQ